LNLEKLANLSKTDRKLFRNAAHKLATAIQIPQNEETILNEVSNWKNYVMFFATLISGIALIYTTILSIRVGQLLVVMGTVNRVRSEPIPLNLNWFTLSPQKNESVSYLLNLQIDDVAPHTSSALSILILILMLILAIYFCKLNNVFYAPKLQAINDNDTSNATTIYKISNFNHQVIYYQFLKPRSKFLLHSSQSYRNLFLIPGLGW
jgi:hypothetical protein